MNSELKVSIIQGKPTWHEVEKNVEHYDSLMTEVKEADLIILPEMWNTGYTIHAHRYAQHATVAVEKMIAWSKKTGAHVLGSIIVEEKEKYFNRLIVVDSDGVRIQYDKKHLFAFAGEDRVFSSGSERIIYSIKDWRLCLNICYDLRFPVWCRNQDDYDVLIFSANWPDKRIDAWDALLRARAIENQAYVIGANCVGEDLWGNTYSGHSAILDPMGKKLIYDDSSEAKILSCVLSNQSLTQVREDLPFLKDKDRFSLS